MIVLGATGVALGSDAPDPAARFLQPLRDRQDTVAERYAAAKSRAT
jgi:hypothetical protein